MASGIEELVGMLYQMITDASSVPFGGKCMIEREKVLDLLDEIKASMPQEIGEAQQLVTTRSEYIASAKREAEAIVKSAEERAKGLVEQEEILKLARQKSKEVVLEADARSKELRKVANEYADDALKRTEEAISAALGEMRQSRSRFRAAAGAMATAPLPNVNAVYDGLKDRE